MPTLSWSQNEVVQAYEEKFLLLEAARKEYEQSVFDLIEELRSALEARQSAISLKEGMAWEVQIGEFPGEFARRSLECRLKTDADESHVQIVARMGTPWGGKVGKFQLGVVTKFDEKLTPWSLEELRGKHEHLFQMPTMKLVDGTWLWAGEVDLSDEDVVIRVRDEIENLVKIAEEIAWEINEELSFSNRMLDVLKSSRDVILRELKQFGWKVSGTNGWWEGMRYLQIDPDPKDPGQKREASFWVGFHPKNGTLMFGHNNNALAQSFAQAVGVAHITHGEHPAGVWKKKEELQTLPNNVIRDGVVELFEKFSGMA